MSLITKFISPSTTLSPYVDSAWMLVNDSDQDKEVVVLPDGRIDLFLSESSKQKFHITLLGISTHPDKVILPAQEKIFAVSFKLLAAEYIFHHPVADIMDGGKELTIDHWGFSHNDLTDFESFHTKATSIIKSRLLTDTDPRKQKLFDRLYQNKGTDTVEDLSDYAAWSSRQINRYFKEYFGLSLKTYCNILRFRAAFDDIKDGKLFPDSTFSDQPHFIRETKKLAGVIPKELHRNKNDRFIQFSTLPKK